MAPFDRVPKSLEGALEAVHALRPFDGGMSAPSSQLQGPLDMGEMPMMARSEDSEATETTASEEEIEVELGRQWSSSTTWTGREMEEAAAAVDKAMAAGWERPRGKNNGGGETIPLGRGERSKDYWLEEMLGAIDQNFTAQEQCSVSRESSREEAREEDLTCPSQEEEGQGWQGRQGRGQEERETFAESLGTWKQGLRAAAEQARPKSATPGGSEEAKGCDQGQEAQDGIPLHEDPVVIYVCRTLMLSCSLIKGKTYSTASLGSYSFAFTRPPWSPRPCTRKQCANRSVDLPSETFGCGPRATHLASSSFPRRTLLASSTSNPARRTSRSGPVQVAAPANALQYGVTLRCQVLRDPSRSRLPCSAYNKNPPGLRTL